MGSNAIKFNFSVTFLTFKTIKMENQKALEIIKALIDESIKKGVMANIDTAVQVAEAFNTIAKKVLEKENEQ